jgi:hypothetical protein
MWKKIKKYNYRLQKIKWRLYSRWLPKIVWIPQICIFFKTLFFLTFFSITEFLSQNFFFSIQNGGLFSRWRFCHFKNTLFSKNPLHSTTNSKTKILMDLQRIYKLKKKSSIGLQAKKFNMTPKIKMATNLEFFLIFYSHSMVYA